MEIFPIILSVYNVGEGVEGGGGGGGRRGGWKEGGGVEGVLPSIVLFTFNNFSVICKMSAGVKRKDIHYPDCTVLIIQPYIRIFLPQGECYRSYIRIFLPWVNATDLTSEYSYHG